jgi:hypothetical protein
MRIGFLSALLLAFSSISAAAQPPKPFNAEYEVRQNGRLLGSAQMQWKDLGNNRWQLTTNTRGDGVASIAGVHINETSILQWANDGAETASYQYSQNVAWKKKQRSMQVNAAKKVIEFSDNSKTNQIPYQSGAVDRHSFLTALMSQVAEGKRDNLQVKVADKQSINTQTYRTAGNVNLKTLLGNYQTVKLERVREDSDGRSTQVWLAREKNWIPLRMLQTEPDGSTLELRIKKIY